MIRERTSASLAAALAEGRVGGRRKKLDLAKRREIAESVITGCKSGAEMARLYGVSQPRPPRAPTGSLRFRRICASAWQPQPAPAPASCPAA